MSRDLFGTDGVRGLAGQFPLDQNGVNRIAKAVGRHFAKPGQSIIIGCDTRESSSQIVSELAQGLNAVGVNAVLAGVIPTPGLAYSTKNNNEFAAGIMVTASHNPYEYNGIKVFNDQGGKLTDEIESRLNELINSEIVGDGNGTTISNTSLIEQYQKFLLGTVSGLSLAGYKIAIDSANGAAS